MFKMSLGLALTLMLSHVPAKAENCHEFDDMRRLDSAQQRAEKDQAFRESYTYSLDLTFVRLNWGEVFSFMDRGEFLADIKVSDLAGKSHVQWTGPVQVSRNRDNYISTNTKLEIPPEFYKVRDLNAPPAVLLNVAAPAAFILNFTDKFNWMPAVCRANASGSWERTLLRT